EGSDQKAIRAELLAATAPAPLKIVGPPMAESCVCSNANPTITRDIAHLINQIMTDRNIVDNTIGQLKDVQNGITWYDDNIEKKTNSIAANQAFIRPLPEIHSVAEIVSHMLVWRRDTIAKLKGRESILTIESPENWKSNEELKLIGWNKLKKDLSDSQEDLVNYLFDKDDRYLSETRYKEEFSLKYLVEGLLHHDLYHLGQIGITIKLLKGTE